MIFGRVVCLFKGHKRGKPVQFTFEGVPANVLSRVFQCPRCGRETRYKVKPNGQSVGAPGDQL